VDVDETKEWRDLSQLDFAWWASNGPSAGHLFQIAIEFTEGAGLLTASSPSTVDLQVFGYGTPGEVKLKGQYVSPPSYGNDGLATVSFIQRSLIARATVGIPAPQDGRHMTGAMPPTVLTPNEYPRMSEMKVPVTRNFYYRPTWLAGRPTPKPGWDVVWIERRRDHPRRKGFVASVVDAWYPGLFLRAVHDFLGGDSKSLQDPPSSRLMGGRLIFTAPDDEYERLDRLLLVSRLDAMVRGRHFEQVEIWSERRVLLAIVRIERRDTLPSEYRDRNV
jgi:hypothetical protein